MAEYTNKELYVACKNKVGFFRSDRFKEWFHHTYPHKQMHHAYGSYSQSQKTSDVCSIPVTAKQHEEAEKNKSDFAIKNQPLMLQVMIGYIISLESRISLYEEATRRNEEQDNEPYFGWCDVEGCENEGCRGGGTWVGYWTVCSDHSDDYRKGKPQPKMKQKAIDRENSRDPKTGYLPADRTYPIDTKSIFARCSFCEEDFEIQNKKQLNPCPKCHKPLKLIKRK